MKTQHHRPDRIPCPVDPRHFVSTKGLQKHLRKCNATKRAAALAACPFYREGCNRGRRGVPTALERAAREEAAKDLSGTKRPRLAPGRKRAAEEMGHERLLELLERVRRAADEVLPQPPGVAVGAKPAEAEAKTTATATATETTKAAKNPSAAAASAPRPTSLKHDSQNDGIVSIALEAGVFGSRKARACGKPSRGSESSSSSSSVAVVELGAGRGYLGAAAADALVRLHGGEERDKEDEDGAALPLKCSSLTLVDRRVRFDFCSTFFFFVFRFSFFRRSRDLNSKTKPFSSSKTLSKKKKKKNSKAYRNKAERHYRSVIGSGSGQEHSARRRNGGEEAAAAAAAAERQRRRPPFELARATVDIADCLLSSLPGVAKKTPPPPPPPSAAPAPAPAPAPPQIAILGKHLCGSATCLALRAAVTQLRLSGPQGEGEEEEEEEKEKPHSLSGLAIATCCHHGSSWSDFAGKAEFLALGFTADEFEVVCQASAWATGGHGRPARRGEKEKRRESSKSGGGDSSDEEQEEEEDDELEDPGSDESNLPPRCWQSRIPIDVRRASGDAAKRLLDGCRVRWLERRARATAGAAPTSSSLLAVEARAYAPEGVTGENRLIVAVPRRRG